MRSIEQIISTAKQIYQQKFAAARVVFLAGSLVRNEGTSASDLDLVVVYDELQCAHRESFYFENWPVEAFVHDPQTLEYFFADDCRSGCPSLPSMVLEGIEIPESGDFSASLKKIAEEYLIKGPLDWQEKDLKSSRYHITDLIDDLRYPRSASEMYATAALLYDALANHYFRSQKLWSAKGKSIPRKLLATDEAFATCFFVAFERLFKDNETSKVILLAEEILAPSGGFFFDSYRLDAPETWRIVRSD